MSSMAMAQDEEEYRWEVGAGIGMVNYEGDFNTFVLSADNMAINAQIVLRRTFNPYSHVQFSVGYGSIKGKAKQEGTFYPDFNTLSYDETARIDYTFNNPLFDLSAIYEYNFFPYGTGKEYRGAKRLTPFVAIGLGFTYVNCDTYFDASTNMKPVDFPTEMFGDHELSHGNAVALQLPIGAGIKYKVGTRTNIALEWLFHITTTDKMDGVKDPYRINTSGILKNTDCYSTLQLAVTYSFGPKCKTCMNSDW